MTADRERSPSITALFRALGLAALFFAAGAGAATEERKPVTRKVTIDAASFSPASVDVRVGDTVVWTNDDLFKHTVTAAGGAFDSKDIPAGGSWSYTVKSAGLFDYACTYHPTMRGTLRVR